MNQTVFITRPTGLDELWALHDGRKIGEIHVPSGMLAKTLAPNLERVVRTQFKDDVRVFWVDDPVAHPLVSKMIKSLLKESSSSDTEEDDEPPSPEVIRELYERHHICGVCSHSPVCAIAIAHRSVESETFATVSACLMFKPKEDDHEQSR